MLVDQLKEIIHLTPARQNQVCYQVAITESQQAIKCRFTPTIDHFDSSRTAFTDPDLLYSSAMFHTGLAVGQLETWLRERSVNYTVNRQITERVSQVYGQAARAIEQNKYWIKEATVAWIDQQVREHREPFKDYQYDSAKCHRDLEFLLQAFIGDLAHASNEKTAFIASTFWDKDGRPVSRRQQEVVIHTWLRSLISNWVMQGQAYQGLQTYTGQDCQVVPAEPTGRLWFDYLYGYFIQVLEHGLEQPQQIIRAQWPQDHIEVMINV